MKNKKIVLINVFIASLLLISIIGCNEESTAPENNDPVITSLVAFPSSVQLSDSFAVICSAYEPDGDSLFYDWSCTSGAGISGVPQKHPPFLFHTKENIRIFYAPDSISNQNDSIRIDCHVRDGKGGGKSAWVYVGIDQNISKLQISFKNISIYELRNLLVYDKLIGTLSVDSTSEYITFDDFTFDTGWPDEDASAEINGEIFTNFHRGYWCGTEKITVDSGKYLIEVEVLDTMLLLSCKNPPKIEYP